MKNLFFYSAVYSGTAATLKLTGFFIFMWLARSMTVEEYAAWGLYYALQVGVVSFALAGIVEVTIGQLKGIGSTDSRLGKFIVANTLFLLFALVVAVLSIALFGLVVDSLALHFGTLVSVVICGVCLSFSLLQSQIVRLEEKHILSLCFSFVVPFLSLIGGCVGFMLGQTVTGFFVGAMISAFLGVLGLRIVGAGYYGLSRNRNEVFNTFSRSRPFVVIAFLGWLSGYGNSFIVMFFLGAEEVARYTFSLTLSAIMQLVSSSLSQVWNPRFYKIVHVQSLDEVESSNRRFFRMQSLVLGLFGGVLIALTPYMINVFGGNLQAYSSMALELFFIISAYVLLTPFWHCQNYFLAHGKGRELMNVVLVTSMVGLSVWVVLIWLLGAIGVYVGFIAQMFLRVVGVVVTAKKYWPHIRVEWSGVVVGLLLTYVGYFVSSVLV